MEKAIEIKRRAQRCIQNGDLDGALNEYEKLVGSEDSDPYNYVLLADLLYKKGDQGAASERYLSAVGAYEKATLYKNAIAVCKKMLRLSLSPAKVLQSLGNLHALDGLSGEAALYFVQYAEHMVRSSAPNEAAQALRQAFDVCQDNVRVLEQLSEAWLLAGENEKAGHALVEAASHYRQRGDEADARRCTDRAKQLDPALADAISAAPAPTEAEPFAIPRVPSAPVAEVTPIAEAVSHIPEPGAIELTHASLDAPVRAEAIAPAPPMELDRLHGFESGRHDAPEPAQSIAPAANVADEHVAEAVAFTEPVEDRDQLVYEEPEPAHTDIVVNDDAIHPSAHAAVEDVADENAAIAYDLDADDAAEDEDAVAYDLDADDDDTAVVADDVDANDDVVVIADDEEDTEVEYEISDATGLDEAVAAVGGPDAESEAVYEIADDEVISFDAAPADTQDEAPVYEIGDDGLSAPGSTPAAPGLAFAANAAGETPQPTPEERALADVEELLARAQEQFRSGDRDEASHTLSRAAQAYETLDKLENAATIYRSLGRGAHATPEVLELWLGNCERRHDVHEGAAVACDLGDRSLNDGDENGARHWFERALALDGDNETARRRLERLAQAAQQASAAVAVATAEAAEAPAEEAPAASDQRVEIAVGRAEAVSFDLAGLLAEFQRGVEAQLAGDAQSHYDLGMTYREMGLLEQAMDSFRNAEQDPRFAVRAAEMTARCLADQGRSAEAATEFRRALAMPGVTAENDLELRFHYANALIDLGHLEDAIPEYERVVERMPEFEDAAGRLDALRRTLGRG